MEQASLLVVWRGIRTGVISGGAHATSSGPEAFLWFGAVSSVCLDWLRVRGPLELRGRNGAEKCGGLDAANAPCSAGDQQCPVDITAPISGPAAAAQDRLEQAGRHDPTLNTSP